jgi:hypothetical protein
MDKTLDQNVDQTVDDNFLIVGTPVAGNSYMTHKETLAGHKTLVYSGVGFPLSGIVAKLRNAIKMNIPVGYQDENGFHTGVKRAEKEDKWPSVW